LNRIGGIHTLRGFNEESLFASSYSIFTAEIRYLLDQNSAVFLFCDVAWYERNLKSGYFNDTPKGFGAGVFFQTRAGLFSFTYALGSEQGNPILLRGSKVHFGFINYF
jgi:hemolysin activation/secretion protein